MKASVRAIASVAYKEFLHIIRDRRILVLIVTLPPLFTLLFGYAFEVTARTHIPARLQDEDQSPESQKLVAFLSQQPKFGWRKTTDGPAPNLMQDKVEAALIIPAGWGQNLYTPEPMQLRLIVDGSDTTTAQEIEGSVRMLLADFKTSQRDELFGNLMGNLVATLPEDLMESAKKITPEARESLEKEAAKQTESAMKEWEVKTEIVYNPNLRFIEYVIPGIIGLILQLLTVTLMACTITREREAGTLSQLMVTSLHRSEIVAGKVLPYLGVSLFLIVMTAGVAYFHFGVVFHQPLTLSLICFLFLLCSLGLGLLISSFCNTQTQAIQVAVFYLLPVFPLSGAFAPLEQLPNAIRFISQTFPLTHFCHAFRMINLRHAESSYIVGDLVFLLIGAIVTCGGAAVLLNRAEE